MTRKRRPKPRVIIASRGSAGARGRRPTRVVTSGKVGKLSSVRSAGTFIKSRRVDTPKQSTRLGTLGGAGVTSGRRRSKTPLPKGKGRFNPTGKVQSRFRKAPPPQISSLAKPRPEVRPDVNPNAREDLFTVGIGFNTRNDDGSVNFFGFSQRFDAPKGTKKVIRKGSKRINTLFSEGIGVFNSREGFLNQSPAIQGIRNAGKNTRNQLDDIANGRLF